MVVEVGVVEEAGDARELEARSPRLDEEERLLAVGDREHDVEPRVALTRHEPLLAVQHPLVSFAHGCRGDGAHVRAGARLRDGPGLPELAVQDGDDPAVALRGREDLPELCRAAVDDREAEAVRRLARLLLERDLAEHAQSCASGFLRHVQHREAGRARLLPHLVDGREVDLTCGGDLLLQRKDLVGDEAADALLQLGDVWRKLGDDHGAGS